MIVVDANVVFAFVMDDSVTSIARALHAKEPEWVVPSLWQSEVLNALLNGVKAGRLSMETASAAIESAGVLLRDRVRDCEAAAILQTAHACRLTAYDATYVVLARSLGVPLVTEDKQILRACPDVARSMGQFLAPPEPLPTVREEPAAYGTRAKRLHTFDHPANAGLLEAGARPITFSTDCKNREVISITKLNKPCGAGKVAYDSHRR